MALGGKGTSPNSLLLIAFSVTPGAPQYQPTSPCLPGSLGLEDPAWPVAG